MDSELFVEVVDIDSRPLPGADGTIISSVMQGPRTAVADARGQMRFVGLAPGDYDLIVRMDGFQSAQDDDIPVRRDEPRAIRIVMEPAEIKT